MWTTCILTALVLQLTSAAIRPPPGPPVTNCFTTFCGGGTVCRIVYDPTTQAVGPICIDPRDLPVDNLRCSAGGEPLLTLTYTTTPWGEIYTTYRCQQYCPADLFCNNVGVCCTSGPVGDKPGVCPAQTSLPCISTSQCRNDGDCGIGSDKCCPTSCGGTLCTQPARPLTCALLTCQPGTRCVESPAGAQCVPDTVKPGVCPVRSSLPCVYTSQCRGDGDCSGTQKCCPTTCGGFVCTPPARPATCAQLNCGPGSVCIERPTGAECISNAPKPGICLSSITPCVAPPPIITCQDECQVDQQCPRSNKCCRDCPSGCRRCGPAYFPTTCNITTCPPGTRCVENPVGARCIRDPVKPGVCPVRSSLPCVYTSQCRGDGDCIGTEKCCPTTCGGFVCTAPARPATCAQLTCAPGFTCIERPTGAECISNTPKPGICRASITPCVAPPTIITCQDQCQVDQQCPGSNKCCYDCPTGCRRCGPAHFPSTCNTTTCPPGTRCVERPAGAQCVPNPVTKPGQCPRFPPSLITPCIALCSNDGDCPGNQKCCARGCSLLCVAPVTTPPPLTCANVLCTPETVCVETSRGPECVPRNKPGKCPALPPGISCAPPGPGFTCPANQCQSDVDCPGSRKCCRTGCSPCRSCVPPNPGGGGEECSRTDCPRDYPVCVETSTGAICVPAREGPVTSGTKPGQCPALAPDGAGICAILCGSDSDCPGDGKCCSTGCGTTCSSPQATKTCADIPCPPGHRCVDTGIQCVQAPCPTEQCVPVAPCSLPRETGPCKAAITRYYYDASDPNPGCRTFTYGGCAGNSNNFLSLKDCEEACVAYDA